MVTYDHTHVHIHLDTHIENMIQLLDLVTSTSPVILAVFIVLIFMSILSWSIVFLKTFQSARLYVRLRRDKRLFSNQAEHLLLGDLLDQPPRSCVRIMTRGAILTVKHKKKLQKTLPDQESMTAWVRTHCMEWVEATINSLGAGLPLLAICASTAPLLGLFGTVWGIMRSFHAYAELKSTTLATVGPGIADALSTTAFGLVVAIPATLAYNTFLVLLNNRQKDLEYCAKHVVQTFEDELQPNTSMKSSQS